MSKLNSHGVKMKRRHTITSGCTLSPRHCCSDESPQLGKWHFVPHSLSHVPRKQEHGARAPSSSGMWAGAGAGDASLPSQVCWVSAYEGLSTWTCVAGTTENIFLRHRALLSLDTAWPASKKHRLQQSQLHLHPLFRALTHHTGLEMPSDSSCPGLEYILCPVHLIVTVCINAYKAQGPPPPLERCRTFPCLAIIKHLKATQERQPVLQSSEFTGLVHRGRADMAAGEEGQLVTQEATQAGNDSGL